MKTKIAIGIFVVLVLVLIPLAIKGIYTGDTRTFVLSILAIVLAFISVTGIANYNKRRRGSNK